MDGSFEGMSDLGWVAGRAGHGVGMPALPQPVLQIHLGLESAITERPAPIKFR